MDNLNFSKLLADAQHEDGEWDPGFEGDRRIIVSQFGFFQRIFVRPRKFNKRFYHQIYDLKVEDWNLVWDIPILSGYCTIQSELSLRFQATLEYAQENNDRLSEINKHIKSNYQGLLKDATEKELFRAEDKGLISNGLEEVEARIENLINETLIDQRILCRANCKLSPFYKDIPEDAAVVSSGHLHHDQVVLQIIRRNYELQQQRNEEHYRQQQEEERSRLEHKELLLRQSKRENDLEKLRELQITDRVKAEVTEEERRYIERQRSEERVLSEKLKHERRLKELQAKAELEEKQELSQTTNEMESYVRRDIELLVLKRQRALLKKEIEKISSSVTRVFRKQKPNPAIKSSSDGLLKEVQQGGDGEGNQSQGG